MVTQTRKSSVQRRKEISDAVLHIIGKRGLTSLTINKIATEIGVTSGALFRHFDTRDDILREVVRHGVAKLDQTFPDKTLPPLERLFTLANNRIELLGPDPGLAWLLRSEQAYLTLPDDAVDELRDVAKRSRKFLLKAIRDGAAEGSIRSDISPEVLLIPVIGTIHTLIGTPGSAQQSQARQSRNTANVLHALRIMITTKGNAKS